MSWIDLARGPDQLEARLRLESPRLGLALLDSTRLGLLLGARLISVLGSDSTWGSGSGLGNQLDTRLSPARSLARAQLGVCLGLSSGIDSGFATRDSTRLRSGLGSALWTGGRLNSSWPSSSRIANAYKGNNTQTKKCETKTRL